MGDAEESSDFGTGSNGFEVLLQEGSTFAFQG